MTGDDAERTVRLTLGRLGVDEATLRVSETIARRADVEGGAAHLLPTIAMQHVGTTTEWDEPTVADADLVAREELGHGGMGVVHVAEQRSLGRDVAVKSARNASGSLSRALVREARIMGALEHPNLVPIHVLGVDRSGAPLLVMKRVEGVSWRTLLEDAAHESWQPLVAGHGDRARANVEILSHLCRALAFAHDRGVIHRDVKPDNVMIGRFGEVYLLDWGVALRLADRDAEPQGIVGTPGYIAPEMVLADPRAMDARTDVYLLGSTLYEVLTGRMPHARSTPLAAMTAALSGERDPIPSTAPPELANLADQAMAIEPEQRVASAEAFRERLAGFLAARELDRAIADARKALAGARATITRDGPQSLAALKGLIEARFGLVAAQRARPGDASIAADLDASIRHLVEREISLRSPIAARALLPELATPMSDLEARVAVLERDVAAEHGAADRLREALRAADTSPGLRAMRALIAVAAVVVLSGLAWIALEAHEGREMSRASLLAIGGSIFVTVLGGVIVGRKTVLASDASRRLSALVVVCSGAYALFPAVTFALGGTMNDAAAVTDAAYVCIWALGAASVAPEVWPNVVVYLAGVAATLAAPRWTPTIQVPVTAAALLVVWRALRLGAARSRALRDTAPASRHVERQPA